MLHFMKNVYEIIFFHQLNFCLFLIYSFSAKVTYCSNGDPYECVSLSGPHDPCKVGCDVNASNALENNTCSDMGCCEWCYQTCNKCSM